MGRFKDFMCLQWRPPSRSPPGVAFSASTPALPVAARPSGSFEQPRTTRASINLPLASAEPLKEFLPASPNALRPSSPSPPAQPSSETLRYVHISSYHPLTSSSSTIPPPPAAAPSTSHLSNQSLILALNATGAGDSVISEPSITDNTLSLVRFS